MGIGCPDDLSTGKFFYVEPDGTPQCVGFDADINMVSGYTSVNVKCTSGCEPVRSEVKQFCRNHHLGVVTKAQVYPLSHTAAGVMMKRVRCMPSKGGGKTKTQRCAVYKVAKFIDCHSIKNPCSWQEPWANQIYAMLKPKLSDSRISSLNNGEGKSIISANHQLHGIGAKSWGCTPAHWFKVSGIKQAKYVPMTPWQQEAKNFAKFCVKPGVKQGKDGKQDKKFRCTDAATWKQFKAVLKAF